MFRPGRTRALLDAGRPTYTLHHTFLTMRTFLLLLVAALHCASASAQSLRVLTTGAFKQVVVHFVPAFEAAQGVKVEVQNDTAGALLKRIAAGETFDVVFLTPAGLADLARAGKVDAASIKPVAKVAIGVAVKAGQPAPPLATVEDFKQAVLRAGSVAYIDPASGGSSGIYLDGLFKRLGMADAVKAKAVLVPGGYAAERVATGQADMAIHQVSEILPVSGVVLVGLLPDEIQNYTTYGYGVAADTRLQDLARKFVAALSTPAAAEVIRAKGMQPVQ